MVSNEEERGIIPRACQALFDSLSDESKYEVDRKVFLFPFFITCPLSAFLDIYTYIRTYLHLRSLYRSICLSVSLSHVLSMYQSIYLSIYLSISYLSICISLPVRWWRCPILRCTTKNCLICSFPWRRKQMHPKFAYAPPRKGDDRLFKR